MLLVLLAALCALSASAAKPGDTQALYAWPWRVRNLSSFVLYFVHSTAARPAGFTRFSEQQECCFGAFCYCGGKDNSGYVGMYRYVCAYRIVIAIA